MIRPALVPPPGTRSSAPEDCPPAPPAGPYAACKRFLDRALALALLVPAAPLILVGMALVKLTSRGPALYSQLRLGRHGAPFAIYKLRTMVHDCERLTGVRWSTPGDPRVTPVGRFLRRTHLDELPQLWNVLKGDMSLVGPRPERPEFVPTLERAIPRYRHRLVIDPGLTGLAQVNLPADTDLDSVRRKLSHDLYYLRHVSFWLDLRLLLCTAAYVAGVPFRVSSRLLRIPDDQQVNGAFEEV